MTHHEPLIEARLSKLRPTQITVGRVEVATKRAQWASLKGKERHRQLAAHWFPAVKGPDESHYIVDHHHLGLALQEEGVHTVWVMQLADLSELERDVFWRMMEFRRWVHPFDHKGRRRGYDAIPVSIDGLRDDPYRSLAGRVRDAGGYAKDTEPYAEFLWADFFRPRIDAAEIRSSAKANLAPDLVARAVALATGAAARYLPGWTGASEP